MAKLKHQEGEYYEQLAGMVDENDAGGNLSIRASHPTTLHQCTYLCRRAPGRIGECRAILKRVLAIGYMDWQGFEKNRRKRLGEKYKPNTIREVATKFGISTSRLMDLRRGAAINREDTQRSKMLKAEKKEEAEGKDSYRIPCNFPRRTSHAPTIHLPEVERGSNKTNFSVLFGTTKYSQSE